MSKAEYTPGPWEATDSGHIEAEKIFIAKMHPYNPNIGYGLRECQANHHLIAAAPENHEANISALHALDQARTALYNAYSKDGGELPHRKAAIDLINQVEDELRAAIAKARGETSKTEAA